MSLDFSLYYERPETEYERAVKLLREAGMDNAANCLEWQTDPESVPPAFDTNITHNLNRMAEEAGIYKHLWRPEEIGIKTARDLIEPLTAGLELLESDAPRFEKLSAENGWGTYKQFVPFVRKVLAACKEHPESKISVSR